MEFGLDLSEQGPSKLSASYRRGREGMGLGDPHQRYAAVPADAGGSVPRSTFPRGVSSEAPPSLSSYPVFGGGTDPPAVHSPYLQKYIDSSQHGSYGYNDFGSSRVQPEAAISAIGVEANVKVHESSWEAPNFLHNGRDIADIGNERPNSLRNANDTYKAMRESNILLVDGLPTDCTRREVSHLFRPFMGYKEIRVVHKEPRRSGEKAMVFCFVEFIDSKHASTAMEALQGYQFDDKILYAPPLKIQFVHFPFR